MTDVPVTLATAPPMPGAAPDDPAINYAERTKEAMAAVAEEMIPAAVSTPGPLVPMKDEDALALAREIEARYLPPPPAPSILTQLNAMKAARTEPPA